MPSQSTFRNKKPFSLLLTQEKPLLSIKNVKFKRTEFLQPKGPAQETAQLIYL